MSQHPHQEESSRSGGSHQFTQESERDDPRAEEEEDDEEELSSPSTDEEDEEWIPGSTTASKRGSGRHSITSRLPSSSSYPSLQPLTTTSSSSSRQPSSYSQPSTSSSSSSQHLSRRTSLQNEPSASPSSSGQSNSPPRQQSSATDKPFNPSTSRKRVRVGPKPRRFQSNAKQVDILMASFEQAERPSKQERLRLAAEATRLATDPGTTVTERNVNVWFQNRRQHLREADRGMRPPVSVKRRRSDEEASSASPQRSPSLALPSLVQHHEYLRRNFLFEPSPIVVIPASSLVVDSWVRNLTTPSFSPSGPPPPPPDLILYANPSEGYFAWYISHAGRGYKMHLPFSTITGFQVAPANSSSTSECVFSVDTPPRMWCTKMREGRVDVEAEDGPWEAIGDFTEGVVSQAREHKIKGADSTTRSTILNIITSNPDLSHLLSSTRPIPYLSMPPPSNAPSSFGPISSSTSSPGSSSTQYLPPPAPRISPSASVARLSLGPFQDAITSTAPPFSISRLPVARPFSSAGERSTSSDLRSTLGSSAHGNRPWTTGEEWEPRIGIEHAVPPLPRQQYLPPPLAPSAPPPSRQRYESEGSFGGDQSSSSPYGYGGAVEESSPGSGSEPFRYQQPSSYYHGQDMPQQRQHQYEDPPRSIQQPHQRFISAPLPFAPRRESAPASSTRPQTSHYAPPPPPRASLPQLSTPSSSSSSTGWSSHSFTNPWPYPLDPSASSPGPPRPHPPQSSSEFGFAPPFAPQQSSYQPHPYRPMNLDPHQQQPHQGPQFELSPPPTAERMEFDESYDASSSGPSYGHRGGAPPPPPSRGGRGGYGGANQ